MPREKRRLQIDHDSRRRRKQADNRNDGMEADAAAWGLNQRLVACLKKRGVQEFFPVQRAVVPDVLRLGRKSQMESRDVTALHIDMDLADHMNL